jgi:hypothetical protein
MTAIPVIRRQRMEDYEFKVSLGYMIRAYLKKKGKKRLKSYL